MTHPEGEIDTESELTPVTREASVVDTEYVQEAPDEGETKVDEVVGKVVNRRKSYNTYFRIGFLYHINR